MAEEAGETDAVVGKVGLFSKDGNVVFSIGSVIF
jgi:hypothetical protein